MDNLDHWLVVNEFSVNEVLLLAVGIDPLSVDINGEPFKQHESYKRYITTSRGLTERIRYRDVKHMVRKLGEPRAGNVVPPYIPDWDRTKMTFEAARTLLRKNCIFSEFFEVSGQLDLLDPDHERYSPKLAAAVKAWLVMQDPAQLKGRRPKKAMEAWIIKNPSEYSKDNTVLSNRAIGECTKVANWKPKGGR